MSVNWEQLDDGIFPSESQKAMLECGAVSDAHTDAMYGLWVECCQSAVE